jgi:hypothetical protein
MEINNRLELANSISSCRKIGIQQYSYWTVNQKKGAV